MDEPDWTSYTEFEIDSDAIGNDQASQWHLTWKRELSNDDYTGTYCILTERKISRLLGQSRVIRIGQGIVGDRISCYVDASEHKREPLVQHVIRSLVDSPSAYGKITVRYVPLSKEDAIKEEKRLLLEFLVDHLELPPMNFRKEQGKDVLNEQFPVTPTTSME